MRELCRRLCGYSRNRGSRLHDSKQFGGCLELIGVQPDTGARAGRDPASETPARGLPPHRRCSGRERVPDDQHARLRPCQDQSQPSRIACAPSPGSPRRPGAATSGASAPAHSRYSASGPPSKEPKWISFSSETTMLGQSRPASASSNVSCVLRSSVATPSSMSSPARRLARRRPARSLRGQTLARGRVRGDPASFDAARAWRTRRTASMWLRAAPSGSRARASSRPTRRGESRRGSRSGRRDRRPARARAAGDRDRGGHARRTLGAAPTGSTHTCWS